MEGLTHKFDVLARHCAAEGRDPADITRTVLVPADPLDAPDAFLRKMESYAALGVEQVWVSSAGPDPASWVSRLGERIVPGLREL